MRGALELQSGRDEMAEALRRRSWLALAARANDGFGTLATRLLCVRDQVDTVPFVERELQAAAQSAGVVDRVEEPEETEEHLVYPAGEGTRPVRIECGEFPRELPPEFFEDAFGRLADDVDAIDAVRCPARGALPGMEWVQARKPDHPHDWDWIYQPGLSLVENLVQGTQTYSIVANRIDAEECKSFDLYDGSFSPVQQAANATNVASIALPPSEGGVSAGLRTYAVPGDVALVATWRGLFGSATEDGGMARPRTVSGDAWYLEVASDAGVLTLDARLPSVPVVENPTPYSGTVHVRAVRPDPATGSGTYRSGYDPLGLSDLPEAEGEWWSFSLPAWSRRPLFGDPERGEDNVFPWSINAPSSDGLGGRLLPATGSHRIGFRIHPDDVVLELDFDSGPTPFHPIS